MAARVPSRGSDQFNLRMPDGMRNRIADLAAKNGRSMNAEIIVALEQWLSWNETSHKPLAANATILEQVIKLLDDMKRDWK